MMSKSDMQTFDFDIETDRRGTHSDKWDNMFAKYGVSPDTGLAMWVADTDFQAPPAVLSCLDDMVSHGVFGYYGNDAPYFEAISGWMSRRHNWQVAPEHIHTTHGLGNGIALCLQAFSEIGDGVIILTPVYHAFARIIKASGRDLREVDMPLEAGRYVLDFDALEAALTGNEKIFLLCSPHNPGGRIWTSEELEMIVAFCERHDLILMSDEIHHDLILPGHKHVSMPVAVPESLPRLVMLTAATKTFNLPAGLTGNVIIQDSMLRRQYQTVQKALAIGGNAFGMRMAEAAYAHGDSWVNSLCAYLGENERLFRSGLEAIPGVSVMQSEATFLSWVDFSGLGMEMAEVLDRVQRRAEIAPNLGETFGASGANFLRFNIGTQRSRIEDAVKRLQSAFSDIQ